jgi:phosphate transport system protein
MERHVRHFEEQLEALHERLLFLGSLVEQAIARSVQALVDRDSDLARQALADDDQVDRLDNEIDHLCVEILALKQPFARDLRFITTAMKITMDLERIADLATNVCERAIELNQEPPLKPLIDIPIIGRRAQEMVRRALDAFVREDASEARAVIALDDELDARMEQVFRVLVSYMIEDPRAITRAIRLTFVAKYFERMGDHVTNICEQIVFMAEGRVIRHGALGGDAPPGDAE